MATHVDARSKLAAANGAPIADTSLAGALQYLTLTRPDLAYAVQPRMSLTLRWSSASSAASMAPSTLVSTSASHVQSVL